LTKLVINPNRVGTFPVICTELCGLGHALMRSEVIVTSEDKFLSWTKSQGGGGAAGAGGTSTAASGKALFVSNGCNGCHTFKPAGAKGTVGPDLDKLPDLARGAGQPLGQFIHDSIVNPDAYVEHGYPKGVMPGTFASLPAAQIDALVKYLQGGGG
jgi:cytochrome c oxidase subunit 2